MMRFRLFGGSDDLVEAEGDISGELGASAAEVMIGEPGASCIVTIAYAAGPKPAAVWQVIGAAGGRGHGYIGWAGGSR